MFYEKRVLPRGRSRTGLFAAAGKKAGILGDIKAIGSFFGHKGTELFVSVQNILILISMAG